MINRYTNYKQKLLKVETKKSKLRKNVVKKWNTSILYN